MYPNTKNTAFAAVITAIVAFPILGTFFPLESYLSAPTLDNPDGVAVPPTIATTLTLMAMSAIIVRQYAVEFQVMKQALRSNWFLIAFAGWAVFTALWADSPGFSFNRSGRLVLGVLYALYLTTSYDRKTMFRILFAATLIGIAGSIAVTIVVPNLSRVIDARGAYRGAYQHKNILGAVAALALTFSYYCYQTRYVARSLCVLLFILAFVALVLANSVTSMIAFALAAGFSGYLGVIVKGGPSGRLLGFLVGISFVGGFYSIISFVPSVLDFTGRDVSTLTGRTDVWRFAESLIAMKPMLGWGHGAWGAPIFNKYALSELQWGAPNAHNTWLDIRLQLGIPGFLIAFGCALAAIKRSVTAILVCNDGEYLVWVTVIVFQGIRSSTETMYVDPSSIETFWLAAAVARLYALTAQRRSSNFQPADIPVFASMGSYYPEREDIRLVRHGAVSQ